MTDKNQCYGTYVSDKGVGPGYQYACIRSGTIKTSGDLPTAWYNYVLASAGTIISENTSIDNPANNTAKATESICPKGWELPSKTQIDNQRDTAIFSPTVGGFYFNSNMNNETVRGYWWSSEAYTGGLRHMLYYDNPSLNMFASNDAGRTRGLYIRCVQKS